MMVSLDHHSKLFLFIRWREFIYYVRYGQALIKLTYTNDVVFARRPADINRWGERLETLVW